jgi:hypothetical protein
MTYADLDFLSFFPFSCLWKYDGYWWLRTLFWICIWWSVNSDGVICEFAVVVSFDGCFFGGESVGASYVSPDRKIWGGD